MLRLADGDELVGVAALRCDDAGVVSFLGSREVTDYPGPVVAPGRGAVAARALLEALGVAFPGWRRLRVDNARPQDGFADALQAAAGSAGLGVRAGDDEPVPVLVLPASVERYREGLRGHPRHELARKRRRLKRERPGAVLRSADAASLEDDLATFFALHRRAGGPKGSFLSPAIERYMREVAAAMLERGVLRLDLLETADAADTPPLAATLGFQTRETFYLYNMAFDPAAGALSPGICLVAALVERAIGDGLARFDFLRGRERYKLELGGEPAPLRRVEVTAG
ncbi:MAG: GNAT family N-acetyltransferase [Solirubrobacterales bacterium]|nr:GNAT family N-acetyltransferase [Solirubrobacterales bacterium]